MGPRFQWCSVESLCFGCLDRKAVDIAKRSMFSQAAGRRPDSSEKLIPRIRLITAAFCLREIWVGVGVENESEGERVGCVEKECVCVCVCVCV